MNTGSLPRSVDNESRGKERISALGAKGVERVLRDMTKCYVCGASQSAIRDVDVIVVIPSRQLTVIKKPLLVCTLQTLQHMLW